MLVAVAASEGWISPVFDWTPELLVFDLSRGEEGQEDGFALVAGWTFQRCAGGAPRADAAMERLLAMHESGAEVLLCGAVSRPLETLLLQRGVEVYAWLRGPVEGLLGAYLQGRMNDPVWRLPGCGQGRRRGGPRRSGRRR